MNRALRRRMKREKEAQKTYTLTARELDAMRENAFQDARRELNAGAETKIRTAAHAATTNAFIYLTGIVVKIMHDDYKWEPMELNKLVNQMLEEYNNTDDLLELLDIIEKYSGFKLELDEEDII